MKYIKGALKLGNDPCVFCEGLRVGSSFESLLIFETSLSMVFLNKYPYNPGHLLILPKRHSGDLTDLSEAEGRDLHELLIRGVSVLRKIFNPNAFNVGLNMGKEAGGGIPGHLHYHIIPRWGGDTNFLPLIAETKVVPADMTEMFSTIKKGFETK
jgi:ATP adenylyltransferase